METITLDAPALYGDHHVIEVRRILFEIPGVKDVYASSCFRIIEVTFDPAQVDAETIKAKIGEAGYLEDLAIPVETGRPAVEQNGGDRYFRHTAAFEQTGSTVAFQQRVTYSGRPLWHCPGVGTIKATMDEGE